MRNLLYFSLFLLLLGAKQELCFGVEGGQNDKADIYRLHPGDTVQVSVWRDDTLKQQVVVLPDGSITLPLAGRVEVAGLSTPEAEEVITKKLSTYISDPVVTVVITIAGGNIAYVLGKVIKPGTIVINGPLSVLQAISTAGGFDKFADEEGIKVIRFYSNGQNIIDVHYKDIISGKNMSSNIQLKAGDTVIVP